jgi:hypothetical protein
VTDNEPILNFGKPIPKALPGGYPAHCQGIETFTINEGTADAKTLIRWVFTLDGTDDPEFPGTEIILDGVSSFATGKRSKMRKWVTALFGEEPDDRMTFSGLLAAIKGQPCIVTVAINDDGYSKADDIAPPLRKPAAPPVPAQNAPGAPAAPGVAPSATEADGGAVLDF